MPPLSILVKPASGSCNLRCRYCFYHSVADSRRVKNYGLMPQETLEALAEKALAFAEDSCAFAFQGGEPTLAGLPFYEKLVEYQGRYNHKNVKIHNAIQTNGIVVDEAWAAFLARNDFLAGLSLDGIEKLHDRNRQDSFAQVMRTAELFNRAGVRYNILAVVTGESHKYAAQSYHMFKTDCTRFLQFIPCLDPLGETRGGHPWSLTPAAYLKFLKTMFNLWYCDCKGGKPVSVRWFDNILGMLLGNPPEACGMSGVCGCQFVTEADGSVYPCDFYVTDRWRIGNILEDSFEEMRNSEVCRRFVDESRSVHPACRACRWYPLCRCGCKRERENGRSYFCECYKEFFKFSIGRFEELAGLLGQNQKFPP